jgi:hypothetical protein
MGGLPEDDTASAEGWYPENEDTNDCRMRFPEDYITDDLFTPAELEAIRAYFGRYPWRAQQ